MSRSLPYVIALLSACALAYEVLLTRLFAIIQWHHFAHMIISLALLGYAASGSFLAVIGDRAGRRFTVFFSINAVFFALSASAGFLLAQQIPFNALEIAWDPAQLIHLALIYLLLAVPFFCVANCFGLAFIVYRSQIHRLYAFDLSGAGAGALIIIVLLFALHPLAALLALSILALLAAAWFSKPVLWLLPVFLLSFLLPANITQLQVSEYKGLSQSLSVLGAEPVAERYGPLGLIQIVDNRQVPFRYAPGLSLAAAKGPGEQLGLFSDGEQLGVITRLADDTDLAYLDYLTSALPYQLLDRPQVLILGAGGGADVLQALSHQAATVDAVELNRQIVDLLRDEYAQYAGHLYEHPNVDVHIAEARSFIAAGAKNYDLIQLTLLDAFATAAAGLYALNESYLYTVEAFQDYLQHLQPGGILAVTRWLRLPPRDSLKLFATAVAALESLDITQPGARLILIRGWKTSTLLLKNGVFSSAEIAAVREFCRSRSFDTAYVPGIGPEQVNRYNKLEQPYLYEGSLALLGNDEQREDFFRRYKFDIRPATDDRPFFFHFFKWRTLPELLSLRAGSGLGQLEWGYLVLLATLLQALFAAIILILLPLWLSRRGRIQDRRYASGRWRLLAYFSAIGLGFLFLEIAFIQKFVLYLGHPLYAIAVVLCTFLIGAGLGSRYADRTPERISAPLIVAGLALAYLWLLPILFEHTLAWPVSAKILLTIGLILPLAGCMGMPFPDGLQRIGKEQIAWAWAINGCASVVSAVLATLLAMNIGFSGVVIAAACCYLLARYSLPRRRQPA